MMHPIRKYPRTQHIEGSRLQPGDEDLDAIPLARLAGRHVVVEEKLDGSNCGISFTTSGELLLQSRGHYLTGGLRERHFALLKQWATVHTCALRACLWDRYVLYGEWMYAKHTVFYDELPHYLMEFDVLDTERNEFLDTPSRRELLNGVALPPVRILFAGRIRQMSELAGLIGPSSYISPGHLQHLRQQAEQLGVDVGRVFQETDRTNLMEGLYVKVEEGGCVVERYKFVRSDFLAAVTRAGGHWLSRPIVPNLLSDGVDLFADDSP